ncbi:hypothetical protein [Micromonospora mirobrigensis]|uniref:hypothetical protein n=1 Tax=Micromonospora mirobrigensis TaxID=262898 RepID=UPI000B86DACD|nr:hypothetical protein [Micromonospora mirobrigensis]
MTVARRAVGALLMLALPLDSGLVFWLLDRATSVGQWLTGALVSLLIPGGLYNLYRLLDWAEFRHAVPGRHQK